MKISTFSTLKNPVSAETIRGNMVIKEGNVNCKFNARDKYKSHNSAMLLSRRHFTMNAVQCVAVHSLVPKCKR